MNSPNFHAATVHKSGTPSTPLLLAINEHKRSGLILCKPYHAEFAGPGAAVGTLVDQGCTAVIAIGSPEIVRIQTHEERQQAYGRRIQWLRWLQRITDHTDPLQRVEKLFAGFEAFFGGQILSSLPDEVLALLAGVLPQTITTVRSQYRHLKPTDESLVGADGLPLYPSVVALHPHTLKAFAGLSTTTNGAANFSEMLHSLLCSA